MASKRPCSSCPVSRTDSSRGADRTREIERERDRERERDIYIYIEREREGLGPKVLRLMINLLQNLR